MTDPTRLLPPLAQDSTARIVLLVIDGVGDLRTADQPRTPLEVADTPNLDRLAREGSCGRLTPVAPGITPGSGPGHLALFGHDPLAPEADIGRGVLEALGAGVEVGRGDVAARGNFATADGKGDLVDRRAGRISTEECRRLCAKLRDALPDLDGVDVTVAAGEGHRFVLVLRGDELSADLADTDPQELGVPPHEPRPLPSASDDERAVRAVEIVSRLIESFESALSDEPRANRVLLRGFSKLPDLPSLADLYGLRAGAFAGYPLYRGVARVCGMEIADCGKSFQEIVEAVSSRADDFDYLFLHVKRTDMAGEDGDLDAKVAAIEEVDGILPQLTSLLDPDEDVVAITADHSTPVPMAAHSWHPSPLVVRAPRAFVDPVERYDEVSVRSGHLGDLLSKDLMAILLAHAGRLKKFRA